MAACGVASTRSILCQGQDPPSNRSNARREHQSLFRELAGNFRTKKRPEMQDCEAGLEYFSAREKEVERPAMASSDRPGDMGRATVSHSRYEEGPALRPTREESKTYDKRRLSQDQATKAKTTSEDSTRGAAERRGENKASYRTEKQRADMRDETNSEERQTRKQIGIA